MSCIFVYKLNSLFNISNKTLVKADKETVKEIANKLSKDAGTIIKSTNVLSKVDTEIVKNIS